MKQQFNSSLKALGEVLLRRVQVWKSNVNGRHCWHGCKPCGIADFGSPITIRLEP